MIVKINAILFAFVALTRISLCNDFWTQLPTYFWHSQSVVMVGHSLHLSRAGRVVGEVYFETSEGKPRRFKDELFQEWQWGDGPARISQFITSYAPGTVHLAYISSDGSRASLGHFPRSDSLVSGLAAICWAATSLMWIRRWRADIRDSNRKLYRTDRQ